MIRPQVTHRLRDPIKRMTVLMASAFVLSRVLSTVEVMRELKIDLSDAATRIAKSAGRKV
jgi:hypothetical protein